MHNLFFTIRPDPRTAGLIGRLTQALRRRYGFTGPAVGPGRLHISLNPLGRHDEASPHLIARASAAAATVATRPFVVALNRVMSFGGAIGRRPLVLGGEDGLIGVHTLHAGLHAALVDAGMARGAEAALTPHLTLLRDARTVPDMFIEPVSWRVGEFVLIDSIHGEGRHDVLGRWRL